MRTIGGESALRAHSPIAAATVVERLPEPLTLWVRRRTEHAAELFDELAVEDPLFAAAARRLKAELDTSREVQRTRAQRRSRSNSRYSHGTGGCRRVRIAACGCRMPVPRPMQEFWLYLRRRADTRDCHGQEGVAGSSPAEGFTRPFCGAVFFFAERLR
jgi:hypothetical protein